MEYQIERERVNYNSLTNNAFTSLVASALAIAKEQDLSTHSVLGNCTLSIETNLTVLKQLLNEETSLSARSDFDAQRDDDLNYLNTMLDAHAISRDAGNKAAATALLSVYGSFNRQLNYLPLNEQTTELDKVLNYWATPENTAHFSTLGLSDDLEALKTSAGAYKSYHLERTNKGNAQSPKVRNVRRIIAKHFVMYLGIMEGLAVLDSDTLCYTILDRINQLIKEQDALLKAKATRNAESEALKN
ncbi:DUF6261 family protein [Saccharicrinis aurantiacus]|uniref:DUF6261 family protein n=1 Tax=Saccharicrinis aurantiacus TaxID=1849719 RepID=UPI0024938983|nr:DUF6261 family protein [Saccharicrinis aurantiacus]